MRIPVATRFSMQTKVQSALNYLIDGSEDPVSNRSMAVLFQQLNAQQIFELLESVGEEPQIFDEPESAQRLERAIPYLAEASRNFEFDADVLLPLWRKAYSLTNRDSNLRNGWLYWLAVIGTPQALQQWKETIAEEPPEFRSGIVWPFAPLLKNSELTPADLADILARTLPFPQTATCAIDLLNFRFREGLSVPHVAQPRVHELSNLLGQVAQQLRQVEEGKFPDGLSQSDIAQLVGDSVALLISLCDLVALCEYKEAEGKLRQVASLRHRRVQAEAYAALARLGFADGVEQLVALANEPSVRLRVLKYAQELGIEEKIDERFRSTEAIVESQMANWLAEPQQMGIAPSRVELVDSRRLFWPGFNDPVDCHLVRFSYGIEVQQCSNIGIVGPMIYAFENDVSGLSLDDLYAAYAGWQVVHQDLFEISLDEAYRTRGRDLERQILRLEEDDFQNVRPQFVAHFFGEWLLVAAAELLGNSGTAIVDNQTVTWFIDNATDSSPQFAYLVYRGGRLLKMFNEQAEKEI
jgi:hypothetical protein